MSLPDVRLKRWDTCGWNDAVSAVRGGREVCQTDLGLFGGGCDVIRHREDKDQPQGYEIHLFAFINSLLAERSKNEIFDVLNECWLQSGPMQ